MGFSLNLQGESSGKPRELVIDCGIKVLKIDMNPTVFLIGTALTWGFAIWILAADKIDCFGAVNDDVTQASVDLADWKAWVSEIFNWFYIGSQDIWILYILYLFFSRFGNVKLGSEKPEFSDAAYFMMMFTCGVAVGLFFYGVTEPLYHKFEAGKNYINQNGKTSENESDQEAFNITMYHWGFHGWVPYTLVGIMLAHSCYVRGLPMCIRSCMYPLIGNRINGWLGDVLDGFSVLVIISGVCTSLGLGAVQIAAGMSRLHPDWENIELGKDSVWDKADTQVIITWLITLVATGSLLSGIHYGIKFLSMLAFLSGMFLLLTLMFLGNTWFQFNFMTQSIGFYFQWLMQLGWHTDAFEHLNQVDSVETSLGFSLLAADGTVTYHATNANAGGADDGPYDAKYYNWWTIFYWGWWIAWSPFVGTFIARISKGRTIREVIVYSLFAPLAYIFWWFSAFGGEGLLMDRLASNLQAAGAPFIGIASTSTDPLFTVHATVPECTDPSLPEGFLGQCVTWTERSYDAFDADKWSSQASEASTRESPLSCPGLTAHLTPNCANLHQGSWNDPAATEQTFAASNCGHQFGGRAMFCTSATTVQADLGNCAYIKDAKACETYAPLGTRTQEGIDACKATCFSCPTRPKKALKWQDVQKCSSNKLDSAGLVNTDADSLMAGTTGDHTKTLGCSKRSLRYPHTTHDKCIPAELLHQWVKSDAAPLGMRNNPNLLQKGKICKLYSRIYGSGTGNQPFFDVLDQWGPFGNFLCGLSIFSLIVYFCTSSDSGSLVIDIMASNGKADASVLQRIFWAFNEALLCTALIVASETDDGLFGNGSLKAFQAGSICCGLPFTVVLCLICVALHRALCEDERKAAGIPEPAGGKWKMSIFGGVFNFMEVLFSLGTCGKEMFPTINDIALFLGAGIAPEVLIFLIARKQSPDGIVWPLIYTVVGGLSYYCWIGLLASDLEYSWGVGWVFYCIFCFILVMLREKTRQNSKIVGNVVEDFFVCLFGFYNALPQMMEQPYVDDAKKDDDAPVKADEVEKEIEDFTV